MTTPRAVRALIVGGRGGIGGAFAELLIKENPANVVVATSRSEAWAAGEDSGSPDSPPPFASPSLRRARLDPTSDNDYVELFGSLKDSGFRPNVVLYCGGFLSDADSGMRPETSLKQLTLESLQANASANMFGAAMLMRHALGGDLVDRKEDWSVFAAWSARVGSTSENNLGGWHAYRASKAALNSFVKTSSIELRRTHPGLRVASVHPGTVDTALSEPFMGAKKRESLVSEYEELDPEKSYSFFTPEVSCRHLWRVLQGLETEDSGAFMDYRGDRIGY